MNSWHSGYVYRKKRVYKSTQASRQEHKDARKEQQEQECEGGKDTER